jgi:hypothetical protein
MADMDHEAVRTLALSLPDTGEQPHFDAASFRVHGRVFLTLPAGDDVAHIFVDEHEVHRAVAEGPESCEELWWGKKLSGVRVLLADAHPEQVAQLVVDAWRAKAPKRLVARLDESELVVRAPRRRTTPGH